jgi:hypothetical protein
MKILLAFLLFLLSFYSKTMAQTTYQQTYWTRLFVRVKLNEKWSWQIEADNRRIFSPQPDKQLQFIAHTHVHRKLSKNTEGSLGLTYSAVWQGDLPVPEIRPFQEFYIFQKLGAKTRLSHRFRTEQRWFHNYKKDALTEGWNFKFRFRYMLRFEQDLSKKWLFKANSETMYHHDAFDQQRFYGGFEYKFSPKMSVELGYLKLWQLKNSKIGYFDRDNLRFTFYRNFDFSKK